MVMMLVMTTATAMTASAGVNFNSTNYIALKRNKKKSAKLKGLTKKQKKKKWTFKSSDTSIVKVKRSGKYGYKLTANKKKDGYAVIRATQSKTAIYLLVKVGKGSTSTNGTTRAWASYGRSHYRQGTSAYNTWNKVVNPNSGGNSSSGSTGSGSTGSGSSGSTGSGSTDWYATHPQYTNVLAVYGARDNKMVPTPATSVVGKDQNGYGYDTNGIIGTDRNGKKIKGIVPRVTTLEVSTVNYMDEFYNRFDNGYYKSYAGKNILIGRQPAFVHIKLLDANGKVVRLDTQAQKNLHGYIVNTSSTGSGRAGLMDNLVGVVKVSNSDIVNFGGTVSDGYIMTLTGVVGGSGTTTITVNVDGLSKSVTVTWKDYISEWKRFYLDKINQIEAEPGFTSYTRFNQRFTVGGETLNAPENVKKAYEAHTIFCERYGGNIAYGGAAAMQMLGNKYNVYWYTPWWITLKEATAKQGTQVCMEVDNTANWNWDVLNQKYGLQFNNCHLVPSPNGGHMPAWMAYGDSDTHFLELSCGGGYVDNVKPIAVSDIPVYVK
jgi:hypothetical protein